MLKLNDASAGSRPDEDLSGPIHTQQIRNMLPLCPLAVSMEPHFVGFTRFGPGAAGYRACLLPGLQHPQRPASARP